MGFVRFGLPDLEPGAPADEGGIGGDTGVIEEIPRQDDPPLGVERQGLCGFENGGGEVVLLVGEQVQIVEAGRDPVNEFFVAGLQGRGLERRIDIDTLEALVLDHRAKRLRNGNASLLVDPIDVPADKHSHLRL